MSLEKKSEIEKREAEERAQIMIDAAPFCTFFWDNNLNLIDCNQEVVKMFELSSKEEFIEKFDMLSPEYQPDGIPSKEKGPALVGIALEEGYSKFEWMHQTLGGEQIPAEITCIRVKHKGDWTVTEYIRDLREQKAVMTEMRKAEIAEESSKAKSDFLAKMSHEIRTPMNAILGITEIQLQDDTLSQSTKDALERIYNSADLLLGIINDILDLSKIESGKLEIIQMQYDIASLIHDTVQLNMMRYESKPIEFKLEIDETIPLMYIGDELRIKQILNNILSNAFKYTQEGRITFSISCNHVKSEEADVIIIFKITDTGQGMTSEQVQKLGSEYSRFNMEANRKTEGTGLGMNITRNLLKKMNASMNIESTPGMGSTFTVNLPQKCTDKDPIGKNIAENLMQLNIASALKIKNVQLNREYMPYGRVLIVDDVETNLYVAKGLLAPYGLSLETALSGFEAVEKIKEGAVYDVVFMDHMMPGMDGIDATKLIRSLGYTKPVVALTANAITGQAEMFLQSGFDDFISKPIDVRQLNQSLNRLVRDKYPLEVVEAARKQKEQLVNGMHVTSIAPQLAEFFIRDAKKAVFVLNAINENKYRRSNDIATFIINIHSMKSALANVGESELSQKASELEQAGRDQNIDLIFASLPDFLEALNQVIEKLSAPVQAVLKEADNITDEADTAYLKEKLQIIQLACVSYDKKTAKEALVDLKKKPCSTVIRDQLSIISEHLLHSEFEEAAAVAGKLRLS